MRYPRGTERVGRCLRVIGRKGPYPSIRYDGEVWKAHRLSYHLNVGSIPRLYSGKVVMHKCDNKWCVEPSHLVLGTQGENIKDHYQKNPERKMKAARRMKGNRFRRGKMMSSDAKRKISDALIGNQRAKGKRWRLSEETRERMKAAWIKRREGMK